MTSLLIFKFNILGDSRILVSRIPPPSIIKIYFHFFVKPNIERYFLNSNYFKIKLPFVGGTEV